MGLPPKTTVGIDTYVPDGDPRATSSAAWVAFRLVDFKGPGTLRRSAEARWPTIRWMG